MQVQSNQLQAQQLQQQQQKGQCKGHQKQQSNQNPNFAGINLPPGGLARA